MKLNIRMLGIDRPRSCRAVAETHLRRLDGLANISLANAIVERSEQLNPPYRVGVVLAVPGPDIHAAARDHTLLAAIHKVVAHLKRQILARKSRRTSRQKTNLSQRRVSAGLVAA